MKTTNKVFLAGMLIVVVAFVFVLGSCKLVFEGDAVGTTSDSSGLPSVTTKAVKLTLTSKSYEIEFDGKTYSGDAEKTKSGKAAAYTWTSGGTGGVVVDKKTALAFSYINVSKGVSIIAGTLSKKSIDGDEISLDDIELIIEE